jgi:hypothetical protein
LEIRNRREKRESKRQEKGGVRKRRTGDRVGEIGRVRYKRLRRLD